MNPLKLKINLENTPHPISRKLLVSEDVNMYQLHLLIQLSMGWEDCHMWEFTDARRNGKIKVSEPMGEVFDDQEYLVASEVSLKETFLEKNGTKPVWYWYDFGDDWWHKLSFQKTNKKDREIFDGTPVCLEAEGACPPEDCGGPWGYADFLQTISDPKHEAYEQLREWAGLEKGDTWPTEAPALDLINQELKEFYQGPGWSENSHL
ncbi:MAG: plasmid pRiA4b ORF-3 family protein [Owenweeksia sp.]|nr:plasmid pRiA4b ORF-3 family protein [Owenweeksia sp.]